MAYVGNQPAKGQFRKLTDISGSFDGVTTTFTTSVPPGTSSYYVTAGSASQLLVSLGGVIQQPDTDYTVSTNSITFTTAPASGLSFFGVLMGDALNTGTPADGSVTTSKLASDLTVDLASGSVSAPSLTFDANTGLYSPGADQVAISTNGTERVEWGTSEVVFNDGGENYDFRIEGDTEANLIFVDASADTVSFRDDVYIDGSGRLLVGTSSNRAGGLFQIETSASDASRIHTVTNNSNNAISPVWKFIKSRGTTSGASTLVQSGDDLGFITFAGTDGTNTVDGAYIGAQVDAAVTASGNEMPTRLVFSTTADGASSPTERMRITNGGNILLGSDNSSLTAEEGIKFVNVSSSGPYMGIVANTAIAGDTFYHYYNLNATYNGYRFYVKNDGGIANFSANNVNLCDEREKKNIENLDSTWDCLKHWELKKFNYNEDADTEAPRYGVIAQQVEPHCPEVITEWKKGKDDNGDDIIRMGVKEQQMYWMAIKALQEAQVRIEQLEAKVAALEGASPNP